MIAHPGEAGDDVRRIKDIGLLSGCSTSRKMDGKEARMWPRCHRGRQEAGEERVVGSISEIAGCVARFPEAVRQQRSEVGSLSARSASLATSYRKVSRTMKAM